MNVFCLILTIFVYIYLVLLENLIVIHSIANRVQPSSDNLCIDVTGVVLLACAGLTVSGGGIHCIASSQLF